ncbi:MAG: hypothetical protein KJN61_01875, partial [Gammaproteobacteria bacterium]|nr:hypothetical protein [Gammaproteobacteria bacterium]
MIEQDAIVIQKLPASRGLAWISGAWELIRKQPLRLLLIGLFFQLILGFAQSSALWLLVVLCMPVLSAGMLHAFFVVDRVGKPALGVLFLPFTSGESVGRLVLLGATVLVIGFLILAAIMAGQVVGIDPEIISRIEQGDPEALQLIDPQIMENTVLGIAVGAAVSGCITYFSVPLIWFRKQSMGRSVITGLRALGRNWKPLLMLGVFLAIVSVPIVLLFGSLLLSTLTEGGGSYGLAFLMLVLGPLFQLLLFGTQYLAFRDVF